MVNTHKYTHTKQIKTHDESEQIKLKWILNNE